MDRVLGQNEEVILSVKNHWILLAKPLFFLILGTGVATLFFIAGDWFAPYQEWISLAFDWMTCATLLASVHFAFVLLFEYMVSKTFVTNRRVIQIKYKPFVIDDIDHAEMERINEVEKMKHGLFKNIFNYGSIRMSIPGMKDYFYVADIKKPSKFVNLIEAIKFNKPLRGLDLRGIIDGVNPRYDFLNK